MDRVIREENQVAGVKVTHPERVIYADLAITKLDVVRYYDAISSHICRTCGGGPSRWWPVLAVFRKDVSICGIQRSGDPQRSGA